LTVEKENVQIQWPASLRSPANKRDSNKYYRYHRDHGHDTEECRQLKNHIEDLIHKSHLSKYVDRDAPQGRREHREEDPQLGQEQQPRGVIHTIYGGIASRGGVRLPHNDPVMVTLLVEFFTVTRVLLDSGSSADILYKLAFDQLRIPEDQLKSVKTPLIGFAGETVLLFGSINLYVIAGS
ncbi:hypothetical protein CFOL_v3_00194, partial [Cephalotus follicularis]